MTEKTKSQTDEAWQTVNTDPIVVKAFERTMKPPRDILRDFESSMFRHDNEEDTEVEECPASISSATNNTPPSFKVGDFVRATYTDGVDYEAQIFSIYKEKDTCLIKYIGYDNEQVVPLSELVESWGKKARKQQYLEGKRAQEAEQGTFFETKENQSKSGARGHGDYIFNNASIPPMPPMPPMLDGMDDDPEKADSFRMMLMSWYMSGYYTGYYEGTMRAKISKTAPKSGRKGK